MQASGHPNMAHALSADELPPALQVDEILQQISKDEQEEWEYEYSATETETFYLTVDLSHPDFKERQGKVANYSRGGYYKAKPVPNHEQDDTEKPAPGRKHNAPGAHEGDDEDDEEMHEVDDAEEQDSRIRRRDKGKGVDRGSPPRDTDEMGEEAQGSLEDIQILDLHSPHPVISYRGRIFEGSWAEMIGTELILTQQKPDDPAQHPPLPALRHLNEGIDLLAASASKILTREKVLKPRVGAEEKERAQALEEVKREWNIRIPLGKRDKEGEKGEQARFLENLMALKKKKGEKDNVTVYARPAGEERREPSAAARRARGDDAARERRAARRRARRAGLTWNRGGTGGGGAGAGAGDGGESAAGGGGRSLSTPTPLRWDDLRTPRSEAAARGARLGEDEDDDVKMSG